MLLAFEAMLNFDIPTDSKRVEDLEKNVYIEIKLDFIYLSIFDRQNNWLQLLVLFQPLIQFD